MTSSLTALSSTPSPPPPPPRLKAPRVPGPSQASSGDATIPDAIRREEEEVYVPSYREARLLPHELRHHVKIYLEEKMHVEAIQLLEGLLVAGGSRHTTTGSGPSPVALIAPPSQLALLGTLAIHPAYTTRPSAREDFRVATRAISYLRHLLATVGPVNADLRTAFEFKGDSRGTAGRVKYGFRSAKNGRGRDGGGDGNSDDSDDNFGAPRDGSGGGDGDEDHIAGKLASEGSVWSLGHDFWRVVGWAFHCSAAHPHRWRYWRLWLEFMLDALEADFAERERRDTESVSAGGLQDSDTFDWPMLQGSLLVAYMKECTNRMAMRSIVKALVADGSQTSFPEVFENEARGGVRHVSYKRKRDQLLDVENAKFGDYLDDDDGDGYSSQDSSAPASPTMGHRASERAGAAAREKSAQGRLSAGLAESVPLRLRLFHLLAQACLFLPKSFVPLPTVYEAFSDAMRDLSAPFFAAFVDYATSPLPRRVFVTFLRTLLYHYLPASSPHPHDVDPTTEADLGVSVLMMRRCFLPYAANNVTPEANAKMSLLIEGLLQVLWANSGGVAGVPLWSAGFQAAAEKGVQARAARVRGRKGGGGGSTAAADEAAREILEVSGQRILALMSVMKVDDEGDDDEDDEEEDDEDEDEDITG